MSHMLNIKVKCPNCKKSLMNPQFPVDDLPSIHVQVKIGNKIGRIYLSQVYGSYNKHFENVDDIPDSIAEFSCLECQKPFPAYEKCGCKATMIGFSLIGGGTIKICTRNGCKKHSLEFVNANDAFSLFKDQDQTGLV